jgi:hypothetical protein
VATKLPGTIAGSAGAHIHFGAVGEVPTSGPTSRPVD